jgi:hypothetical protein
MISPSRKEQFMFTSLARIWDTYRRRLRTRAARRPASRKKDRWARLEVEGLEERTVPTVVFQPHYGPETLGADSQNHGMVSPPVYVIFWGAYWGTANGSRDANTFISEAKSIFGSSYLTGLTQYGSDGKATFQAAYTYTSSPKANFNMGDVQNFINAAIKDPASPIYGPEYTTNRPIYVVVTDPNASFQGGYGGYNQPGTYMPGTAQAEPMHMVWSSTMFNANGVINQDSATTIFSHELVESMSVAADGKSWVDINAPAGLPAKIGGDGQIGDNEPDGGRYTYRVNGVMVQAYWSNKDSAFIVPDGNQQKFYLDPLWDSNDNFTGRFNLFVQGDQLGANYNDQIGIRGTANTSTGVTMNGESAWFDAGKINTINVNTGGGFNTVNVYSVPQDVTLNINSIGRSIDNVIVGDNGSLAGIAGTVNVANASGQTYLTIDASNDGAQNITVTDHSVGFGGLANINYSGGVAGSDGNTYGVYGLSIWDGQGANQIEVDSVAALTPVAIWGDTQDNVFGPASGQVNFIPYRT